MTESDARPARFSVLSPRVPSDVRVTYYIYIRPGMVHGIMPVKAGYVYTINISYLRPPRGPTDFFTLVDFYREKFMYI